MARSGSLLTYKSLISYFLCLIMISASSFLRPRTGVARSMAYRKNHLSPLVTMATSERIDNTVLSSAPSTPTKVTVFVDTDIARHLCLKGNLRKTKLLISDKVEPAVSEVRASIEKRVESLTGLPYKLRYRLSHSHCDPTVDAPIISDSDLHRAIQQSKEQNAGIQLFVQVNPGVFPPIATDQQHSRDDTINSSVAAMRAARVDPADSAGYAMVSFYGFRETEDPAGFALQLEQLWRPFHALGRVYVASEGVNAQMAVPDNALPYFEAATRQLPVFAKMRLNCDRVVSRAQYAETKPFRALHVRVREQILADGFEAAREDKGASLPASDNSIAGSGGELDWTRAGKEMAPLEWHRVLTANKHRKQGVLNAAAVSTPEPVVLDCRNSYESDVGTFEGAVPLNTTFFRESWPALDALLRDTPRDAPVLTFCTGGIRCVKVNAYLQQRLGFTNTHRLAGGIIAYDRELEAARQAALNSTQAAAPASFPTDSAEADLSSRFRGLNYVFDERIAARITPDVFAVCEHCAVACDSFTNCPNGPCNVRFIQCSRCRAAYGGCCSKACHVQHASVIDAFASAAKVGSKSPTPRGALLSRLGARTALSHTAATGIETSDAGTPSSAQSKVNTETRPTVVPEGNGIEHAYNSDVLGGGVGLLEALTQYSEAHSMQEPANLAAVREETLALYAHSPAAARMLCDPLQGRVLALLSTLTRARYVLELGAFTGYSAVSLCQGMPGDPQATERKVVTCEPDPAARAVAARHIALAGLQGQIDLRADKAADVFAALRADEASPLLDIAFIDADKKQYVQYVQTLIGADGGRPLLADGALIIVDNTLWKGLVLKHHLPPQQQEPSTASLVGQKASPRMQALAASMHAFNTFVAQEGRHLQPVLLPLRDGLTVVRYRA